MSMKVHAIGRTARIIKPYSVNQLNGRNGTFESRMVMFSFATDRDYKHTVTANDGTVTQERQTDFFACRATGPIADLFNKYCSATKKDENGNDKLVSRRIYIEGHEETYQATRNETIQLNVNGQLIQAQVALPDERKVIVVESIEFLDANPVNKANNAANGTAVMATVVNGNAQPAQFSQPVQQAQTFQAVQPVQQTQPTVAAPVTPAMPTVPVAGATSPEVAPF